MELNINPVMKRLTVSNPFSRLNRSLYFSRYSAIDFGTPTKGIITQVHFGDFIFYLTLFLLSFLSKIAKSCNDTRGLKALPFNLPPGSTVYGDAGYTDYLAEDNIQETEQITLAIMGQKNSRRPDEPCVAYIKQHLRHPIETLFSKIIQRFAKSIHAVTIDGFLMKILASIMVYQLESAFIS